MERVNTLLKQAEEKEKKEAAERRAIQAHGIEKAEQAGVKFGGPPKPLPPNFDAVYRLWKNGQISRLEVARRVNMPEGTFRYRSDHKRLRTLSIIPQKKKLMQKKDMRFRQKE